MAESLYTKYRPQVFSDVVGQSIVESALVNACLLYTSDAADE